MIILGIDPGFGRLGFSMLEKKGGVLKLLDAGLIETSAGTKQHMRLAYIYDSISALIKKYKPSILAIERLFFAANQKTAIAVAEARGVALLTAGKSGLKVYEYTPPEVKRALTGDGRADKKAVQKMVMLALGTEKSFIDDTADELRLRSPRRMIEKTISPPSRRNDV